MYVESKVGLIAMRCLEPRRINVFPTDIFILPEGCLILTVVASSSRSLLFNESPIRSILCGMVQKRMLMVYHFGEFCDPYIFVTPFNCNDQNVMVGNNEFAEACTTITVSLVPHAQPNCCVCPRIQMRW